MKKLLSLAELTELASAYLKSAYISAPQWDVEKKRWVHISPHGEPLDFELWCPGLLRHAQNRRRHQTASTLDVATVPAVPSHPPLGWMRPE